MSDEPKRVDDWLQALKYTPVRDATPEENARWESRRGDSAIAARRKMVPTRYVDAYDVTSAADPVIRARVAGWNGEPIPFASTVLVGPSGAGKSTLAAHALRALVALDATRGLRLAWVSASELATARIQHRAGDGEPGVVERAMRAHLLILDDLGNEKDTATNAVADVIQERYAQDLPTWVTTGLSSAETTARYGAGISRRVWEGAHVVRLGVRR